VDFDQIRDFATVAMAFVVELGMPLNGSENISSSTASFTCSAGAQAPQVLEFSIALLAALLLFLVIGKLSWIEEEVV